MFIKIKPIDCRSRNKTSTMVAPPRGATLLWLTASIYDFVNVGPIFCNIDVINV